MGADDVSVDFPQHQTAGLESYLEGRCCPLYALYFSEA